MNRHTDNGSNAGRAVQFKQEQTDNEIYIQKIMKGKLSSFLLLLLMLLSGGLITHAQYDKVWTFGLNAGVDFNYNPPRALTTGISSREACASICDANGQLLFYSDGVIVWDKNNDIMPNGNNLGPQLMPSASQGVAIVPIPGSLHRYYIFSLGCWECGNTLGRIWYSEIDMSLNNGLGDVVPERKTIELPNNTATEHMIAIPGNNCDIWLIILSRSIGGFKAFNITKDGINTRPVTSSIALPSWSLINYRLVTGYMDIAPDRSRMAIANNDLILYDFDPGTGRFSNPITLLYGKDPARLCYGTAFSPDGSKLYTFMDTTGNKVDDFAIGKEPSLLVQFDLTAGDSLAIVRSMTIIDTVPWTVTNALKRAPDGKVYSTSHSYKTNNPALLGAIQLPDLKGKACRFTPTEGLQLQEGTFSFIGLPNTISGLESIYTNKSSSTLVCGEYNLTATDTTGTNYMWYDGSTGVRKQVGSAGIYWVRYHRPGASCIDIQTDTFRVSDSRREHHHTTAEPEACWQDTLTLSATYLHKEGYTWQDGQKNTIRYVTKTGTYWLTYHEPGDECKTFSDSFSVTIPDEPYHVSFTVDSYACSGHPLIITNTSANYYNSFTWYVDSLAISSARQPDIMLYRPGSYNIKLTGTHNDICPDTVVHHIVVDTVVNISFGLSPKELCTGEEVSIHHYIPLTTVRALQWHYGDGHYSEYSDHIQQHSYDRHGTMNIVLNASFRGCPDISYIDSVQVHPLPLVSLGTDSVICLAGNAITLKNKYPYQDGDRYLWSTGITDSKLSITHEGNYSLLLTDRHGCSSTESIHVHKDCYIDIPNAFTPNGDGINDYFFPRQLLTKSVTHFRMEVYNRWGQLLFATTNPQGRGWDGMLNHLMQPEGVYVYLIEMRFENGHKESYKGNVMLIR